MTGERGRSRERTAEVLLVLCAALVLSISGCSGVAGSNSGGGNPPPPVAVSNPMAGNITATTATISWTTNVPADSQVDYGRTASYGQSTALDPAMVTSHSATLSNLTASTLYHYRVKSRDAAGNLATSNDLTFTTSAAPDTTPPTVSISSPASGANVSGTIAVTASASDNVGVAGVQLKVDGNNAGAEDTAAPYTFSLNTTTLPNGSHSLTAVARDAAGNTTTSAAVSVNVNNASPADTTPPSIPAGLTAAAISSSRIDVSWNASTDNVGVAGYKVFRAGVQIATATGTSYQDIGLLPSTLYTYSVAAFDAAGNNSSPSAPASATTLAASARVIEIFPSNADATCIEEFENVANTLRAGDQLVLHGGVYSQSCRRHLTGLNGTATNPIIIRAAVGESPILTRPAGNPENNIEIEGSSYLAIRGLKFQGGSSGVRLMSGNHITFEDNEIYNTDNNALRVNDTSMDSLVIRHTHIHHTGLDTTGPTEGEGMYLGCNNNACRVTNSLIEGNYIHHLRGTSSGGNDGIEAKVGSYGNIIRDNVIHDTNIGTQFPCIFVYGGGSAVNIVEGNAVWNCGEGIYAVADAVVRNNIVLNSETGISSYPHTQVAQTKDVTIVNNTIYGHPDCLFLRWSSASNMILANNAVYCGGNNAVNASGLTGSAITISSNYVEGNVIGASVDNSRFFNGGTAAAAFISPTAVDFWPATTSLLKNTANAAYVPALDFNATPRTSPYDVGAYETEGRSTNPGWKITAGFKTAGTTP